LQYLHPSSIFTGMCETRAGVGPPHESPCARNNVTFVRSWKTKTANDVAMFVNKGLDNRKM